MGSAAFGISIGFSSTLASWTCGSGGFTGGGGTTSGLGCGGFIATCCGTGFGCGVGVGGGAALT
jgi:hypothetical protein